MNSANHAQNSPSLVTTSSPEPSPQLRTVDPTAEHDPSTYEGRRRNDIRLRGSASLGRNIDYDVKIYSFATDKAHKTTSIPVGNKSDIDHALDQSTRYLESIGKEAIRFRPLTDGAFKPLVFSTGGLMAKGTADELRGWKLDLKTVVWESMMRAVSMSFVRSRARTWGLAKGAAASCDLEL
jgi:hypothetical protein